MTHSRQPTVGGAQLEGAGNGPPITVQPVRGGRGQLDRCPYRTWLRVFCGVYYEKRALMESWDSSVCT